MQAEKLKQESVQSKESISHNRASFAYPASHRGPNYALVSLVLDLLGTIAAVLIADLALEASGIIAIGSLPFSTLGLVMLVWPISFFIMSAYDTSHNYPLREEAQKTILATALSMFVLMGLLYLSYTDIPRSLIGAIFLLDVTMLIGWRVVARIGANTSHNTVPQRVLIIGANDLGRQVAEIIQRTPWSKLEIFGYLDTQKKKAYGDLPIVGNLDDVRQVVEMHAIEEVVVALPHSQYEDVNDIVMNLQTLPVQVRIVPSYLNLALYRATIDDLGGLPLINLRGPALSPYQRLFKRAFDIVTSAFILFMILPVMAVIAIAIKMDSSGPVFFRQLRVGENGRMFKMYKFRSMVVNAEALQSKVNQKDENGNIIHKTRNDPRVTRIGRILRKTSLDELPQFINVIKGEMSLVGPRPELPWLVEKYEPWQRQRFAVPQGITGWWQVNGRSDKPCHLNTDQDLYYIENYSFWLDIRILIKTVPALLKGKGAF